jgi:predicted O-methyltransferase YrrM
MRYQRCGVCNQVINTTALEDIEYERAKKAPDYPHQAVLASGPNVVKKLVCSAECEDRLKQEFEEKYGLADARKVEQSMMQSMEVSSICDICAACHAHTYVVEILRLGKVEEKYTCCTKDCSEIAKRFFAKKNGLVKGATVTTLKEEAVAYFIHQWLPEELYDSVADKLLDIWRTGFEATGGHGDGWPVGDIEGVYLMVRAYLLPDKDPLIVEVGCGTGYSASIMSGALSIRGDKGRLISYDDDPKYIGITRDNLAKLPWKKWSDVVEFGDKWTMNELDDPASILFIDSDDDIRPLVLPNALKHGSATSHTEIYLHDVIRPREKKMCEDAKSLHGATWEVVVKQGMNLARIHLPEEKK